ncbi:MAG: hypothetical protein LIO46_02970 [Clostridiales bacterium]|nr:hypothetical protein [Clostridiales bacterium]
MSIWDYFVETLPILLPVTTALIANSTFMSKTRKQHLQEYLDKVALPINHIFSNTSDKENCINPKGFITRLHKLHNQHFLLIPKHMHSLYEQMEKEYIEYNRIDTSSYASYHIYVTRSYYRCRRKLGYPQSSLFSWFLSLASNQQVISIFGVIAYALLHYFAVEKYNSILIYIAGYALIVVTMVILLIFSSRGKEKKLASEISEDIEKEHQANTSCS